MEGDVSKRNHPISSSSKSTPPPYRMPPHPLYNDHAATGNMVGTASSNQQIHTHSSKFPVRYFIFFSSRLLCILIKEKIKTDVRVSAGETVSIQQNVVAEDCARSSFGMMP